jgi:molybdate transport system substrate-binding protein
VQQIAAPDAYNVTAVYPMARVAGSSNAALAQEFIEFVLGEEGQSILTRWGFGPAPGD